MRFHTLTIPITAPGESGVDQTYRALVSQAIAAERRGFAGFWVAEHHFSRYGGAVPLVGVILSHLAAHTSTIRLGAGVAVLSLRLDAVATVEEFAMVDALSQGRLELGVGRGFMDHEFAGKGVADQDRGQLFDRNLEILERFCMGAPGAVAITPPAAQAPIPMWIAVSTNIESCRRAAAGGHGLMLNPYNRDPAETRQAIGAYLADWNAHAHDAEPRILINQFLFAAESQDAVRPGAEAALNSYLDAVSQAIQGGSEVSRLSHKSFDDIYPDKGFFGTPERIVDQVTQWQELGVTDISLMTHFGSPASPLADNSADLFAAEVIPVFAEGGADGG